MTASLGFRSERLNDETAQDFWRCPLCGSTDASLKPTAQAAKLEPPRMNRAIQAEATAHHCHHCGQRCFRVWVWVVMPRHWDHEGLFRLRQAFMPQAPTGVFVRDHETEGQHLRGYVGDLHPLLPGELLAAAGARVLQSLWLVVPPTMDAAMEESPPPVPPLPPPPSAVAHGIVVHVNGGSGVQVTVNANGVRIDVGAVQVTSTTHHALPAVHAPALLPAVSPFKARR